jgi:CheY-like chemotaxis protein
MARILVVEDEKDLQEVIAYNLRQLDTPSPSSAAGVKR